MFISFIGWFHMEKINVSIPEITKLNQFLALPPVYEYKGKIWRIYTPTSEVPDVIAANCDYLYAHDLRILSRNNEPNNNPFNTLTDTVYLDRYDKALQSILLERLIKTHYKGKLKHFNSLQVSEIVFDLPKHVVHFNKTKDYVIKPILGTRGMGVIEVTREINLKAFIDNIADLRKNPETTNQGYKDLCDAFGVKLTIGQERYENEMAKYIAANRLLIQELNPHGHVVEFRAIMGGETPFIVNRDHFYSDAKDTVNITLKQSNPTSPEVYAEIMELLSDKRLQLHGSVDVWYAPTANRWGIYEYQNQYGHVYLPMEKHIDYLKETIALLHDGLLKLKGVVTTMVDVGDVQSQPREDNLALRPIMGNGSW